MWIEENAAVSETVWDSLAEYDQAIGNVRWITKEEHGPPSAYMLNTEPQD